MKFVVLIGLLATMHSAVANIDVVTDHNRNRDIPIKLDLPKNHQLCSTAAKCPVVLISAGYGLPHDGYGFLSEYFNERGYLTIAVAHELPLDPPLSVSGDLYKTRSENWRRGAETLGFLQQHFIPLLPHYDFESLTLVGHSNGGDISSWVTNADKDYVRTLITLDHRRVPLPRNHDIQVLSIRASDYPADHCVLPDAREQQDYGICVITLKEAKHNDMWDGGPSWLKEGIVEVITDYMDSKECPNS